MWKNISYVLCRQRPDWRMRAYQGTYPEIRLFDRRRFVWFHIRQMGDTHTAYRLHRNLRDTLLSIRSEASIVRPERSGGAHNSGCEYVPTSRSSRQVVFVAVVLDSPESQRLAGSDHRASSIVLSSPPPRVVSSSSPTTASASQRLRAKAWMTSSGPSVTSAFHNFAPPLSRSHSLQVTPPTEHSRTAELYKACARFPACLQLALPHDLVTT